MGTPTEYQSVDGTNHFTIVEELVNPDSAMVRRIVELRKSPVVAFDLDAVDDDKLESLIKTFHPDADESDNENNVEPDPMDSVALDVLADVENIMPAKSADQHAEDEIVAAMEAEEAAEAAELTKALEESIQNESELSEEQPASPTETDQTDATAQEKTQ